MVLSKTFTNRKKRTDVRCRWSLAVLLCGLTVAAGAVPWAAVAGDKPPAVVIHESVWDGGERGSWSAFTARVSSGAEFHGELWLVPAPLPHPGRQAPVGPEPSVPSLHVPLVLEPGVERMVSVMAPIAGAAYRAEVRDRSGGLVVAGEARQALAGLTYNVGLLTDRPREETQFVGSPLPLNISRRFASAVDFPSDVLSLEGLEAIVIADFDSGALNDGQRKALQDFVALGGALIITGGGAAARTLTPLPEALVPLRPDGIASASLAPLLDLVNETTSAVTTVATGQIRSGRTVVGGLSGPPLIVEAAHGLGLIVELTYDPYEVADQPMVTRMMRSLVWSVGLARASASRPLPDAAGDGTADTSGPAWAVLDQVPRPTPSKGGPVGLLLLAYPLVIGCAALLLGRRRTTSIWQWAAVPALAAAVTAAVLPVGWGLGHSALIDDEVIIERMGSAASAARVEAFHRLVASARGDEALQLGRGTLASTADAPRPAPALPTVLPSGGLPSRSAPAVVASGGGTRVELGDLSGWDVRRLHTLSLPRTGGALEAHLRLQAGRVVGTVTNNGPRLVRRMRVQAEDGTRAELGAVAPPGAIVQVDAPFSGEATLNGSIEAAVLNIAAKSDRRSLGPGELALVGLVSDRPVLAGHESVRHKTAHRAVVTTVQLEAADDFVLVRQPGGTIRGDLAFGSAKSVCCGASQGRGIFEIRLPTGMAGPFGVEVAGRPRPRPQNLPEAAVYDWTGGTWRPLSPNPQTQAPIAPAEIMDGLVRIRLGTDIPTEGLKAVAIVAPK